MKATAAIVAAVAAAAVLVLWASLPGPGLTPDSLKYLLLARSLVHGDGFRLFGQPEIHFPPGYPSLLGLAGAVDPPSLMRAGVLQAGLAALNVWLVAMVTARAAGARSAGVIAAVLFAVSPAMVALHAMVWSEAAFLALLLAAMALAGRAFDCPSGYVWIGCGLCLGLAVLTRYAGIALLPGVLLVIVRRRDWSRSRRLTAAAVLTTSAIALPAAWCVRNAVLGGAPTDRPFVLHGLDAGHLRGWVPVALAVAAACALARRRGAVVQLAAAAAASYVALLAASIAAFDADTPLDSRILAPLYPLALVVLAPHLAAPRLWLAAPLAVWAAAGLAESVVLARGRSLAGEGFNTRYWRDALRAADLGPGSRPVYTNVPEWVAFETGRDTRDIPARHSRVSLQPRAKYSAEIAAMCDDLRRGAVLAYFEDVSWRWEIPDAGAIHAACHPPATPSPDRLHSAAISCPHEGSCLGMADARAPDRPQR